MEGYPEGRQNLRRRVCVGTRRANGGLNVDSVQEPVVSVKPGGNGFELRTAGATYQARQVVVASGARMKKLEVPGESEFEGRGVSQCADCDGPMFQNEEVAVIGGGDSALQEALVLARFCGKSASLHREASASRRPHFVEQVSAFAPDFHHVAHCRGRGSPAARMVEGKCAARHSQRGHAGRECAGVVRLRRARRPIRRICRRKCGPTKKVRRDRTLRGTPRPGDLGDRCGAQRYSGLLRDAAAEKPSAQREEFAARWEG